MYNYRWKTDDGELIFDFTFVSENYKPEGLIEVRIYYYNIPNDKLFVTLTKPNVKVNFQYLFQNACRIKGTLYFEFMPENQLGVWGNFYYGKNLFQHFEGIMVMVNAIDPHPPIPPEPFDPDEPVEPFPEIITPAGEEDLFPYTYMRKWPSITKEELTLNFVQYTVPELTPPPYTLYDALVEIKKTASPQARDEMLSLAVNYINGTTEEKFTETFISDPAKQLTGPILYFAEIDTYLRKVTIPDPEELIAEIEKILQMDKEKIIEYLQSDVYLEEKDSVWQSYFALIIVLGYRYDLLKYFTKTLVMANLLNVIFLQSDSSNDNFGKIIKSLAYATIILPPDVFPLPPYPAPQQGGTTASAEKSNWIEPYAIGDLQMVRQKFLKYVAGEVAYIENVMKGEKKKTVRRRKNAVKRSTENISESKTQQNEGSLEATNNKQNEILKIIADNVINTTYNNLTTSYGPPTTATLNGGWSTEVSPKQNSPTKEDITLFARNILNKSVNIITRNVIENRVFTVLDENEEETTSVFDNQNGNANKRGIYRWLNKVYLAEVINYGNRLIVEIMLDNPSERYIKSEYMLQGISLVKPVPPEKNGIKTFNDITPENYASLASEYKAKNVSPPSPATKTVSVSFQNEDEKLVALPSGYIAKKSYVTCAFPQGTEASAAVEGIVGTNKFTCTPDSATLNFEMNNESGAVPAAVIGNAVESTPATQPDNFVLTVEIECAVSETLMDEWEIKTYNTIIESYERQKELYYQNVGAGNNLKIKPRSPLENRKIEHNTLKAGCFEVLFETYAKLVGFPSDPLPPGTPPQYLVNEPRYYQFFNEVFEWQEMVYTFSQEIDKDGFSGFIPEEVTSEDELFTAFLQASAARIIVPVRPSQDMSLLYFLSSGMLWQENNYIAPANNSEVEIVNELKNMEFTQRSINKLIEPWEIVVPTSMVVLQESNNLPSVK